MWESSETADFLVGYSFIEFVVESPAKDKVQISIIVGIGGLHCDRKESRSVQPLQRQLRKRSGGAREANDKFTCCGGW
jgi:hypothetical protein